MGHAEPLFLINDQKSQILVLYIRRQHTVRADHNVHHALL